METRGDGGADKIITSWPSDRLGLELEHLLSEILAGHSALEGGGEDADEVDLECLETSVTLNSEDVVDVNGALGGLQDGLDRGPVVANIYRLLLLDPGLSQVDVVQTEANIGLLGRVRADEEAGSVSLASWTGMPKKPRFLRPQAAPCLVSQVILAD